ncbi:hypothetical protein [Nonomuraea sp. NPDC001831]|uniref:hypothetical protein n=1 Tax=Nonomuraea sp. NPDC001831 TaxID=3364340 RepID=UPI0036ADBE29
MLSLYVLPLRLEWLSMALSVPGSAGLMKSPSMAVIPLVQPGDCLYQDLPAGSAAPIGPPLT